MKFDDMINNANEERVQQQKRSQMIISREIAVIPCGGNVIGRMGVLNRSLGTYEPAIYLFMRFGFKIYAGYGDRGGLTYTPNSYDVTYKGDGQYKVDRSGPVTIGGVSHRFHVATFGIMDEGTLTNVDRFNVLFREAEESLKSYSEAMRNSNDSKFRSDLTKAYYEKINELSEAAIRECGVRIVDTMEGIRSTILKACRTQKGKSIYEAKREFAGEAASKKSGEGIPPNLITALIIVGIALFAAILLI